MSTAVEAVRAVRAAHAEGRLEEHVRELRERSKVCDLVVDLTMHRRSQVQIFTVADFFNYMSDIGC